jgi:hypothetical protein
VDGRDKPGHDDRVIRARGLLRRLLGLRLEERAFEIIPQFDLGAAAAIEAARVNAMSRNLNPVQIIVTPF